MIFFSLQIIFKKSNCELYILHVLAILGDNKTSCLFWAKGQGGGVIQIEKNILPVSLVALLDDDVIFVESDLSAVSYDIFQIFWNDENIFHKVQTISQHKFIWNQTCWTAYTWKEREKKAPSIGLFYFASHISVIHGKVFQSILSITLY